MITQETEPAKVGDSKLHWWQALREYADDAKTIGFKKRVALFLVLFCIPLTAYVMSFLNGTETGIRMDEFSSSSMSSPSSDASSVESVTESPAWYRSRASTSSPCR